MSPENSVPDDQQRRTVLKAAVLALNAVMASLLGIPVVGYVVGPLFRKREALWVEAGSPGDFSEAPRAQRLRYTARTGFRELEHTRNVWISMKADELTVFSSECPHVGCNVLWKQEKGHFVCPCHGGVFDREGTVLEGPPPRPLQTLPGKIENGTVYVQV